VALPGSVAPLQRVRIVYSSGEGPSAQEVELPLKLLILGDFTRRPDETFLEERRPVNVDQDNFDQVMASHDLRLDLDPADRLHGREKARLQVSLRFKSMSDFEPSSIIGQVPELRSLVKLRALLTRLKASAKTSDSLNRKLEAVLSDPEARSKLAAELGLSG